jgi:hypothetical protein
MASTDRASLGSFLFVPPAVSSRTGRELGLHVRDALAGGQQLLDQQVPQTTRALHRPGPLGPVGAPIGLIR